MGFGRGIGLFLESAAISTSLVGGAYAAQLRSFDLPAQPVARAIPAFARQAGIRILARGDILKNKRSNNVRGAYSVDAALALLLRGTGLSASYSAGGVVIVQTAQAPEPAPPVAAPAARATQGVDGTQTEATADEAPDIVVTASRAARSGFDAPTPTTTITSDAIDRRQSGNIADVLNEIPALVATTTPSSNGIRPASPGASSADLRGLGARRTLVLVNGMRLVPQAPALIASATFAPDLNQIPTLMIDRVEVVTGGASAQWGSDAVSGVVNILLKNRFSGLEARVQSGVSEVGDAASLRIAMLGGTDLFGGRGHIVAGFDYSRTGEAGDIYSRDWGRQEYGRVANSAFATNGQPATIIAPNVHDVSSPGGRITGPTSFSLRDFQFLPGGAVTRFVPGTLSSAVQMIGGEGVSLASGLALAPGSERFAPYLRAEHAIGDATRVFVEGGYTVTRGVTTLLASRDSAIRITRDNAFLPASVVAAMGSLTSFTMSRTNSDFGNVEVRVRNETPRLVLGVDGTLGGGWKWDAHIGWSENRYVGDVANNRINQNLSFATDAVVSNGRAVCRATLAGAGFNAAAAGCVPINLFGNGSPSAEALAYVTATSRQTADYSQRVAAANLTGEPFSTWAGPVSVALGAEYRRETIDVRADAISNAGGYGSANAATYSGAFDVKEAYVEVIAPVLRNLPGARALDLNGAVRIADYSSSGTQPTWKVGAVWTPLNGVRVRIARSRDIRAPQIHELSNPGNVTFQSVTINGVSASSIPQNSTRGDPDLDVEKADTFTAGVVIEPSFVRGLSLSADYFDIRLKDAITNITGPAAATRCNSGSTFFCSLFTYTGNVPTAYNASYLNAAGITVEGIDFSARQRIRLGGNGRRIDLSLNGTYLFHYLDNPGFNAPVLELAGDDARPRLRATLVTSYTDDRGYISAQVRYVAKTTIENLAVPGTATSINLNEIPRYFLVNLNAGVNVGERFRLSFEIENLFDRDPSPNPNVSQFTTTPGIYHDTIGRYFRAGVSLKL